MLFEIRGALGPALCLATFVALAAPRAGADEIHVPADAPTIQAAVDLAQNGDTLVLAPGFYSGPGDIGVQITGKWLHIVGTGAPGTAQECVLDPSFKDRALVIRDAPGGTTTITGVTFRFGTKSVSGIPEDGGAVLIDNASVVFRDCILEQNGFLFDGTEVLGTGPIGGAINAKHSELSLIDCILRENWGYRGGAVAAISTKLLIERCEFVQNTATSLTQRFFETVIGEGGALYLVHCEDSLISDSVFRQNFTASLGGAIAIYAAPRAAGPELEGVIRHCTFWNNGAGSPTGPSFGRAIGAHGTPPRERWLVERCIVGQGGSSGHPIIDHEPGSSGVLLVKDSNVKGGHPGPGNTRAAPGFVAGHLNDLRLAPWSPLIDAAPVGDVAPYLRTDLLGRPRLQDGDLDGVARADLGAYEFAHLELTTDQSQSPAFSARVTGTPDLEFVVWMGRATLDTPVFLPGQGLQLVDLVPGAVQLVPPSTIPAFHQAAFPPGIPSGLSFALQAFAVDRQTGFGNTSGVATLTAP